MTTETTMPSVTTAEARDGGGVVLQRVVRVLRLNLKTCFWDDIAAERKPLEYRLMTPYWKKRLIDRTYDEIHLLKGYPKRGDESRTLRRQWTGEPKHGPLKHPYFGNKTVMCYAIDVSKHPNHRMSQAARKPESQLCKPTLNNQNGPPLCAPCGG